MDKHMLDGSIGFSQIRSAVMTHFLQSPEIQG